MFSMFQWPTGIAGVVADNKAPEPSIPEWERRPFALSPPEYYTQAYPNASRARLERALRDHVEGEKEK